MNKNKPYPLRQGATGLSGAFMKIRKMSPLDRCNCTDKPLGKQHTGQAHSLTLLGSPALR